MGVWAMLRMHVAKPGRGHGAFHADRCLSLGIDGRVVAGRRNRQSRIDGQIGQIDRAGRTDIGLFAGQNGVRNAQDTAVDRDHPVGGRDFERSVGKALGKQFLDIGVGERRAGIRCAGHAGKRRRAEAVNPGRPDGISATAGQRGDKGLDRPALAIGLNVQIDPTAADRVARDQPGDGSKIGTLQLGAAGQ